MKIITIEEHVSDRALAQACQQAQAAEAAYFGDWAKASKDGQNPSTENIPKLVSAATAMAGAANMGAERIIYAVDYPYLTNTGARDFLENAPITAEQKALIGHGNAERLFKL